MRKLSKILLIVIISVIFKIIFSVLLALFTSNSQSFGIGDESNKKRFFKYQLLEYDIHSKRTNFGIVDIPRALEFDKYITFHDNEGHYSLISNFGSGEFLCNGICYCGNERKALQSAVTRRLGSLLVAASSSVYALKLAKENFPEECQSILLDDEVECPADSIVSDVEECVDLHSSSTDSFAEAQTTTTSKKKAKRKKYPYRDKKRGWSRYFEHLEYGKYLCSGSCLRTPMSISENREYPCENIKREEVIEVGPGFWYQYIEPEEIFRIKYLWIFCWEESKFQEEYVYVDPRTKKSSSRVLESSVCFGGTSLYRNPTIKCKKLE